jgi:cbb3-type cytochrome oxidase subunit 3
MPLELTPLMTWMILTVAFIAIIALLYRRVTRASKQEADERKDETPPY